MNSAQGPDLAEWRDRGHYKPWIAGVEGLEVQANPGKIRRMIALYQQVRLFGQPEKQVLSGRRLNV